MPLRAILNSKSIQAYELNQKQWRDLKKAIKHLA